MWLGVLCFQVLKGVAATFPDFVVSNLGQGVTEAFDFQSRLWAAKHPGQPLPKGKHGKQPHPQLSCATFRCGAVSCFTNKFILGGLSATHHLVGL
jgi:hypothetical protein